MVGLLVVVEATDYRYFSFLLLPASPSSLFDLNLSPFYVSCLNRLY